MEPSKKTSGATAISKRVVLVLLLAFSGCAESTANSKPPAKPSPTSGTALETYLPLVHGNLITFRTEDQDGKVGQIIARVVRDAAATAELKIGSSQQVFEYREDAILLRSKDAIYLKAPIAVGTSWPGEHGCAARIASTDRRMDTPAGAFSACVEVVETCGEGVRAVIYTTVLCPRTGITMIEAKRGSSFERATLISNGPPIDLGQDGVRRVE